MQYLQGARALKDDPHGGQVLLTGSLLIASSIVVPLLGQIAFMGWQTLLLRRLVRGEPGLPPLELDLDALGKLVGVGFRGFIAGFVWSMPPMILLWVLTFCVFFALGFVTDGSGPTALFTVLGVYGLVLPLFLFAPIPAYWATLRAELSGDLNEALKWKEVLAMVRTMGRESIVAIVMLGLVGIPIGLLGLLLCCIGIFPAIVVAWTLHTFIFAELYQRWLHRGGEPVAPLAETSP